MHFTLGMAAGAESTKAPCPMMIKQDLAEDRASRIAGAQKQHIVDDRSSFGRCKSGFANGDGEQVPAKRGIALAAVLHEEAEQAAHAVEVRGVVDLPALTLRYPRRSRRQSYHQGPREPAAGTPTSACPERVQRGPVQRGTAPTDASTDDLIHVKISAFGRMSRYFSYFDPCTAACPSDATLSRRRANPRALKCR